jgi:CBS domain-containing protein
MTYEHNLRHVPVTDPVNSLMSWPVATVEITDSVAEVSRELAADEIGAVLVLQDGVLVGVVSERDVAEQLGVETDPTQLTAGDVMSVDLVTVPPEAPILEAARIMLEARVRHLPVVSDGLVAGILSIRDVFRVLLAMAEVGVHDTTQPAARLEMTWRRYQRAVWLVPCPMCGRETDPSGVEPF